MSVANSPRSNPTSVPFNYSGFDVESESGGASPSGPAYVSSM